MAVALEALFTSALGLQAPWSVEQVELDTRAGRIDFTLTCKASRLTCPHCKAAEQPVHDRIQRQGDTWISFSTRPGCTPGAAHCLHGLRQDHTGRSALGTRGQRVYRFV